MSAPAGDVLERAHPVPAAAAPRQLWPDAARGVLILLVVLWHLTRKHYAVQPWVPEPAALLWEWANLVVRPVRVPLFFAVSGFLTARALHRPWRVLLTGRVLSGYWTYLVWLLLGSAFFTLVPSLLTSTAHTWGELLLGAVVGYSNAWYLYALAAYAVVAKLCLRLPLRLALGLAAVLAVVADVPGVPSHGNTESLMRNLIFFLAAALRPDSVERLVARADRRSVRRLAIVYVPAAVLSVALGATAAPGLRVVLSALGAVLALQVAVCASRRWPRWARPLGWLGRRTLPVYVLHLPLLGLLHLATAALPPLEPGRGLLVVAVLYPPAAVALVTAVALALHGLLARPLPLLFRPPAAWTAGAR